ncbi:zinc finger protein 92-like [Uranotaenia lowii]|uniref:zinc finger protein 92-like n=1 Tax=Uranotaenia lowii TaxID=190385 RepID=UPI00247A40AD|nr:zinc finger protein 92-like [Uranotaenia lowii]
MDTINLMSCRLCLSIPSDEALTFSIFDTVKGKVLRDTVEELFSITLTNEDQLLNICLECVDRICTVQKIYDHFVHSNEQLRGMLQNFGQESQTVVLVEIDTLQTDDNKISDCKENTNTKGVPIKLEAEAIPTVDFILDECSDSQEMVTNSYENVELEHETKYKDIRIHKTENEPEHTAELPCNASRNKQNHEIAPKYKCYFCKTVFDTEIMFTEHLHVHFGEVPLTCDKCDNLVIKSVRQASKHLALHDEDERPHKCRICELRFFTRENSLTHERKIHRMKVKIKQNIDGYAERLKSKRYQCSYCGQCATTNENLRKHEMIHVPQQKFHTCHVCQKQFTARKNLTRHLMIHTGELPYKCDQCDRAFRQAGDLKDHIRRHTKEKPYKCIDCGNCFRNISLLHVHRKKCSNAV